MSFGILALAPDAIGVFGVVSFAVAERTHELGIRVAFGASNRNVIALIVGQSALFAGVGAALGSRLAWAGGGLLRSQLYRVPPHDPAIYTAALVTVGLVTLLASYLPATRAARIDPIRALLYD